MLADETRLVARGPLGGPLLGSARLVTAPPPRAPQVLARRELEDPEEPRPERPRRVEALHGAERAEERLLRHVLGARRVVHDRARRAVAPLPVAGEERGDRFLVARPEPRDEILVLPCHGLHHALDDSWPLEGRAIPEKGVSAGPRVSGT